ncbi:MAG: sigma-70 family RNA polymerase sigma factor [Ruminiclostridium sp.]
MKHSRLIRDSLEDLYTLGPGMEKPATNTESIRRMKQLLKVAMQFSLTDRQREVVQMYYLKDISAAEIAKELSISRQAVHKLLRLSRKKLQKIKNIF